jgi:hypothetical protein
MPSFGWPFLGALLLCGAGGCRIDCASAGDCERGERCAATGLCESLPHAAPVGAVTPGAFMEAVAVYPPPQGRGVAAHTPVFVLTTRPADPATLTASSFAVEDECGHAVAGAFDVLVDPPGFLFAPAAPLAAGTSYNVHVSAAVTDGGGQPLRSELDWSFTVAGG